jgi:hypothetical protein
MHIWHGAKKRIYPLALAFLAGNYARAPQFSSRSPEYRMSGEIPPFALRGLVINVALLLISD